ncbi:MAG: nucleotidyltransferase substrate binding protein [Candidatus Zeuxoniibacter abyssi]|nr:MAG: nucleotidyltransferase substrate binding protein [Candidatus Persebacteraceae bacterium AB1(2)]
MGNNTDYLNRCIGALAIVGDELRKMSADDVRYDIYRAACVKEFEIILEQSGKLLKKILRGYFATNKEADQLMFKDIFRYAVRHGLIETDACERWITYRDNRNNTAHDYGENFAENTLPLLPDLIDDAKALSKILNNNEQSA